MPRVFAGGRSFDVSAVLFDKDGTLFDFKAMWMYLFLRYVARLKEIAGADESLVQELYASMGVSRDGSTIDPMGPLALATTSEIRAILAAVLYRHGHPWGEATAIVQEATEGFVWPALSELSHPIGDLVRLFRELREAGLRIAVVTTDKRERTRQMLELAGVWPLVDALAGEEDVIAPKPAPDGILTVCERLGIAPAQALMVGDSPADMLAGRAAGTAGCVGVTSGIGRREDLEPYADVVIESVQELRAEK
ncbi:MAG: HAD family hydrolase [Anaerolineae bacterium]|nr:HAD family hydrolase [Anaerolineae bacterium]